MIDIKQLTIQKAHDHLKKGDFTVLQLAEAYLAEAQKVNPELNIYLELYADVAEQASRAQKRFEDGTATELTGIPLAIKDNILLKGKTVTSASNILTGYKAPYTATALKRLEEQGMVFLGRVNMDEFAMGASTETSAFGVTKNPCDATRVAGGTSGGSAAVVAANCALVSLGSDTGGSIRQPSSFCGVVGFKPSYGAVSRYGLMAMTSSLDQIGPLGKTVDDAKAVFTAMAGRDEYDATSIDYHARKVTTPTKKIGVPRSFLEKGIDDDVKANFEEMLNRLRGEGYEIVDIDLPLLPYAVPTYYIIVPAEVSSNLARYDGMRFGLHVDGENLLGDYLRTRSEGFGREVKRRIILGTYVLSAGYYDAYYGTAQVVRTQMRQDFIDAFSKVDAIALPTTPTPAFRIGEKSEDPIAMYLADIFTCAANLVGVPAISVPSGTVTRDGKQLPVGFQFVAPHFAEQRLFDLGRVVERIR
jgi:aspartyl-tRNA(Asn)/glutamyl-tRNA(Gln) amidotransferase subunit A